MGTTGGGAGGQTVCLYREQEKGLWALGAERAQLCSLSQGPLTPVGLTPPGHCSPGAHALGAPPSSSTDQGRIPLPDPAGLALGPASEGPQERVRGGQGAQARGAGLRFGLPGCCWWRSGTTPPTPPRPALPPATREHVCWAWAWLLLWSGGWQHRGVVGEPGLGVGLSWCESHSSLLVFSF